MAQLYTQDFNTGADLGELGWYDGSDWGTWTNADYYSISHTVGLLSIRSGLGRSGNALGPDPTKLWGQESDPVNLREAPEAWIAFEDIVGSLSGGIEQTSGTTTAPSNDGCVEYWCDFSDIAQSGHPGALNKWYPWRLVAPISHEYYGELSTYFRFWFYADAQTVGGTATDYCFEIEGKALGNGGSSYYDRYIIAASSFSSGYHKIQCSWHSCTFDWDAYSVNSDGWARLKVDDVLVCELVDKPILVAWGSTSEATGRWGHLRIQPPGNIDDLVVKDICVGSQFYDCSIPASTPEDLCDKRLVYAYLEWDVTGATTVTYES